MAKIKEKTYTYQELWSKYKEFRASLLTPRYSQGCGGGGMSVSYSTYKDEPIDFLLWLESHK